jgi:hypothetical protein
MIKQQIRYLLGQFSSADIWEGGDVESASTKHGTDSKSQTNFQKSLKVMDHLTDLSVDERILLKQILQKSDGNEWIEFFWTQDRDQ